MKKQFYCSTVKAGTLYKVLYYTCAVIWVCGDKRPHELTMWIFMLGPCGYKENRIHIERWGLEGFDFKQSLQGSFS